MDHLESVLNLLIDSSSDPILVADVETGITIHANASAEEMFGYEADRLIGMHWSELHPEPELEIYRERFSRHLQEGGAVSGK